MRRNVWLRAWPWVFSFCLTLSTPAWAVPSRVVCELAALPSWPLAAESREQFTPEQLIEKVVASYRGLLEFAGDEFSGERLAALLVDSTSLEKFFEPVPVAEQRSVALNQSLAKLGDWVLGDAEDNGVLPSTILSRLRETVRAHIEHVNQERGRVNEVREERRYATPIVRVFAPFETQTRSIYSVLLGEERLLVTGGLGVPIRFWNYHDLSSVQPLTPPREGRVASVPIRLGNSDQFLVQYLESDVFEVWNWRTLERVGEWSIGAASGDQGIVSPSLRFVAVRKSKHLFTVLDLQTGQVHNPVSDLFSFESASWSLDGRYLATTASYPRGDRNHRIRIHEFETLPNGQSEMKLVFDQPLELGVSPRVLFGGDNEHLFVFDNNVLRGVRIGSDELQSIWGEKERVGASLGKNSLFLRRAQNQLIHGTKQGIEIFDSFSGAPIWKVPLPAGWEVRGMMLSPSQRLLAVQNEHSNKIWIWDLDTRSVHAQLQIPAIGYAHPVFSEDERALVIRDRYDNKIQVWNLEDTSYD